MSAKTKIVVLRMKKLIFTGLLVLIAILCGIVILALLFPKKDSSPESTEAVTTSLYQPGIYTSSIMLDGTQIDIQVSVDEDHINSISLVQTDESIETMYPLITPTLEQLADQIISTQSLDNIAYEENSQYTSIVLLDAVKDALKKASSD